MSSDESVSGTAKIGARTSRVVRVLRQGAEPSFCFRVFGFGACCRLIRIIKLYKAIYEARQLQKKKEAGTKEEFVCSSHVSKGTSFSVCVPVCLTCICMYVYIHIYVSYIQLCVYICMYIYIYIHIYIYICIYIHMHMPTCICRYVDM